MDPALWLVMEKVEGGDPTEADEEMRWGLRRRSSGGGGGGLRGYRGGDVVGANADRG